ncbi:MAG: ShlB/FhaC/HecB family hemolysin secretion/activation protein [Burkholderiales bacterium]|nr:ShlB/FhaC/HecB family hemolysin secretion/activation protein [Burkholderiales bacterium]
MDPRSHPAKPGDILDTGALERDLAFINATNDLRTSANLKPGKTFGTVDAEILTQEPARFGLTVFGDNAGREEIGRTRLGLVFNARNVFGRSDPLTVSATGADGTAGGSIAYSLPITTFGTRLGLQYDASAIDIRRGPFAALDITGTASNAGIQLIQPLVGTLTRKVNFFVGYNTKDSITKFGGTPVTRADTRNISIGVDAQGFSATDFWYTRHAVTIGTTQWGGDQDFVKYNADALWSRSHDNGLVTQLRGSVQLTSNQQIPTFEQFFVGGMATVRGYQEGVLIGPRGWFASGELQFPLWSSPNRPAGAPLGDRLRGVMFLDHGAAVPASSSGQTLDWKHTLWSTGFGLLYNFSRFCSGRIMLGLPLADRSPAQDDWVVHAYVQSIVF